MRRFQTPVVHQSAGLPPVNRFLYRAINPRPQFRASSVSVSPINQVVVPVITLTSGNTVSGVIRLIILRHLQRCLYRRMSRAVRVHSTYPPEPIVPPAVTRYTTPDDALNNVVPDVTGSPIVPYTFAVIIA